jgi:hypothetical protein
MTDLAADIFNGPGTNSWPMAYVVVASLLRTSVVSGDDCTAIEALVELLSWTQVNDRAATAVTAAKFFPLTILYYKRVIDQLGSVVCAGSRALGGTAFLIGQGTSLQSISDWVQSYSSDEFVLKVRPVAPRMSRVKMNECVECSHFSPTPTQYFTSNTVTALGNLAEGTRALASTAHSGLQPF